MADRYQPELQLRMARLIEHYGPMNVFQIAEQAGEPERQRNFLNSLHRGRDSKPKRFYIIRYELTDKYGSKRMQFLPVWANGNRPDAKRPKKQTHQQTNKTYYFRHHGLILLRKRKRLANIAAKKKPENERSHTIAVWKHILGS